MKKILVLFLFIALFGFRTNLAAQQVINGDSSYVPGAWQGSQLPNAASTGTILFSIAKLTGAGTAVISATTDTSGMLGVVGSGAGTTGNATIAQSGQVQCNFDGATTANDYAVNSPTVAGDCHDAGSTPPTLTQTIGRVLSTNGGAGAYTITLSLGSSASSPLSLLSSNNVWTANQRFQGPDPLVDISAYGARAAIVSLLDISTTVLNCTSGSPTVTLAGTSSFINGDGVAVQGCGAANVMSTPSAPTVTPIYAKGGTRTHNTVNSPTAAATYQYLVVAADKGGGLTLPSAATTITNGQSSLGLQTIGINAASRSNDTVTITTASAVSLISGQLVEISSVPGNTFNGWFLVAVVTDSTHFTLTSTVTDARNQTAFITDQTSASSGGTLAWYAGNKVAVSAVTGAIRYYMCGERPGDVALHVVGQTTLSYPTSGFRDLQLEDWGSTYMGSQTYPYYISDSICTAVLATNDALSTTIISGGGTTSVTLAANAGSNSVSGDKFILDAAPNILNAANAAAVSNGVLYIPPSCNTGCVFSFPINSYLKLPAKLSIFQAGALALGETIETSGSFDIDGSWANTGAAQFGTNGGAHISVLTANPGLHLTGNGNNLKWLNIDSHSNGSTLVVADNSSTDISHVQFNVDNNSSSDYLGIGMIYRDTTNTIADHSMDHSLLSGGPDQVSDKSWTPLMWLAPCNFTGTGCNTLYDVQLTYINFNRRGIEIDGAGNCPNLDTNWTYAQGLITPQVTLGPSCSFVSTHRFVHMSIDTTGESYLANLIAGGTFLFDGTNGGAAPPQPMISGFRPTGTIISRQSNDGNSPLSDVNRGLNKQVQLSSITSYPFETTGSYLPVIQPFLLASEPNAVVGGYSKYWVLPAPTSITVSVSAGGSVPVGSFVYSVSATGYDGGETIMQPVPSAVATTTGGNQTVTVGWTPTLGAVTYNVYRCFGTCTLGGVVTGNWYRVAQHVTGVSYADTAASPTQTAYSTATATGVTGMNDKAAWSLQFACPETTAPSGVSGFDILYCDSTAHNFKVIANNGTAQSLIGFGDAIDLQANPLSLEIANAVSTGTTINLLAKLTGAPSTAVLATTTDTVGVVGCVVSGAGTSGKAVIAVSGTTVCTFDGATTAGDYVIVSTSSNGKVHDAGGTEPTGVQTLGRVLSSNGGGGAYAMIVFPPDQEYTAGGGGGGGSVTSVGLTNSDTNLTITGSPITTSGTLTVNFPNYSNHFFLGNHTGGSAAPAPVQPTMADIAAGAAGSGTYDFSGITLGKWRLSAGLTTSANGDFGYDTTNKNWHIWENAGDKILGIFGSTPAGSKCLQSTVSASVITITEAATACGTGGTVTSVALTAPTGFTVSGSPITSSGTITLAMPSGWVLGDLLGGSGSNTVARVVGNTSSTAAILTSTGSAGVAQAAVFTPTVGGGTNPPMVTLTSPSAADTLCESGGLVLVNCPNGVVVNTQSGTTYTVLSTDRGATISFTSASAKAVTLPQAGSAGFASSFVFGFSISGGGAATITPTTSTITARGSSGLTSLVILSGQSGVCYSDNTNYVCSVSGFGTGTTGSITGTALTATCDSGTVTINGAVAGQPVEVSSTTGADVGGAFYLRGSVTSSNTVTVYVCGTGTPSSLAYNVRILP